MCAEDLAADDPLRLELEAEGRWLLPPRTGQDEQIEIPYWTPDAPDRSGEGSDSRSVRARESDKKR